MYSYGEIAFRPIGKEDLDVLRALHNDESTFLNLATIDFVDENAQLSWWEGLHKKPGDKRYAIVKSANPKEVIGRLRIVNIDTQNRNCEVGLDILPESRRKNYGTKSYEMVLEFLFMHYNMNLVYLKVADFNPAAKDLYLKVGFKLVGHFPEYLYRHGKYWNYLIMAMTRSEYMSLKK